MITFQDFLNVNRDDEKALAAFVLSCINTHIQSDLYQTAKVADLYDKQQNKTINEYVREIYTLAGAPVEDFVASNNKIASNFFRRLNVQRCTYSLGNGIYFANDKENTLKESLGVGFDKAVFDAGYYSLIHGVCFAFWNLDKLHVFPVTEFAPMWDETDGNLKAGIRFWQLDTSKPMVAILYEIDGYTVFKSYKEKDKNGIEYTALAVSEPKRKYKETHYKNQAGDEEIIGEDLYSELPVIPMWGSRLKQSTLIGMRESIDSYDLIRSGFANDLTDCAEIYWLIENHGGMSDEDLAKFRDRLKINHIVEVPDEGAVRPYTQDIPFQARSTYLQFIRTGIYEDFGGLDVHQVSASSTNDHLEAAYQPMDENADDFEYQVIQFIQQVLVIAGKEEDTPIFKRNRISNTMEQVQMVMMEANYLDEETILNKLPNITPDEVKEILERKDAENMERMGLMLGGGVEEEEQGAVEEEAENGDAEDIESFGNGVIEMLESLLEEWQ